MSRIDYEKHTVEQMIRIYCRHKHSSQRALTQPNGLCPSCSELLAYSHQRLSRCPFGEHKSTCRRCKVHCYRPEMRHRIAAVMRYAGPRMMLHHPFLALKHWLQR